VVEKLCQRFKNLDDRRQWRDIAYCLSLLPYKSEKSFKKLTEGMAHYQDKLNENDVYKYFTEIIAKVFFLEYIEYIDLVYLSTNYMFNMISGKSG
jgi:hypothetical protein